MKKVFTPTELEGMDRQTAQNLGLIEEDYKNKSLHKKKYFKK